MVLRGGIRARRRLRFIVQEFLAARADLRTLLVDHRGVTPERAADLEMLALDDPLRPGDFAGHDGVRDRPVLARGAVRSRNERHHAVPADEIVLEADEEPAGPRVALPPGAPAQLVVDAPALVPVRAEHIEAAQRRQPAAKRRVASAEDDVGAAAGHVGGDRDGARHAGPGDNHGLTGIVAGVEHAALDAPVPQRPEQRLRLRDARRADQHRPARRLHARDLVGEGFHLRVAVREDDVRLVHPHARAVRRKDHRRQPVELPELRGGGFGGGRHAGETGPQAHEVLDGDRPEHDAIGADVEALLGFHRGLDAVRPAPVVGHAPGELVDELDAAAAHDVVAIAMQQHLGVKRHVNRRERQVLGRVVKRAASAAPIARGGTRHP